MSKIIANHANGFDAFDAGDGVPRLLTLMPPTKMMAAPSLAQAGIDVIPRDQWRPTNRLETIGANCPRYNQGQVGQCELVSEVECIGQRRAIMNLPPVRLSPSFPYAMVANAPNEGASIGDGYPFLQRFGTCRDELCPAGTFFARSQLTQAMYDDARNYRAILALHARTFDELATLIQLDVPSVGGVVVGRDFNQLDSEGCYPVTRGMPNHAVSAWDLVRLKSGEWGILWNNHWGLHWGMEGNFIQTESAYNAMYYQDVIGYYSVSIDDSLSGGHDLPPVVPSFRAT